MNSKSWQPTATKKTLELRAAILSDIRSFFFERSVLEVETPVLSVSGTPELGLESLETQLAGPRQETLYLHTSPEHAMKRLLAAGSGDIFQLCKVFRDAELGRWHQPEFTMLEWYRIDWDEKKLMQEAELLLKILLKHHYLLGPSNFLSYREAFNTHLAVNPLKETTELAKKLATRGIDIPTEIDWNGLLDLALSSIVLPALDPSVITFIFDFPADQAQLARIKYDSGEQIAARFEVFFQGLEIGNGFGELTDPTEQRNRFEMALMQRKYQKRPIPPIDDKLLAALENGLPACAGMAMGIDRIVALVGKLPNVAKAISFAYPL